MAKKKHKQITESTVAKAEAEPAIQDSAMQQSEMTAADYLADGAFVEEKGRKSGMKIRHRKFVKAFLGQACGNYVEAYKLAGYPVNNWKIANRRAREILFNPHVQAALAREFSRQMLNASWAKSRVVAMANSSMSNFIDSDGGIDMNKAAANGALDQIKKIKVFRDRETGIIVKHELELYDRLQAGTILLKILGLLVERHKVDVNDDTSKLIRDAMAQVKEDKGTQDMTRALADRLNPKPPPRKPREANNN